MAQEETVPTALSRNDAYSLMSVAADFGITQVVDARKGIHVRIGRGMFPARSPLRSATPTD